MKILFLGDVVGRTGRDAIASGLPGLIEQFKFDFAVIGCSALDGEGDLLDFDIQEVGVSQTIIRQARKTCLVSDASKFQRSAPARIASLSEIDSSFTARPLPGDLAQRCAEWGTHVEICGEAAP